MVVANPDNNHDGEYKFGSKQSQGFDSGPIPQG